MNTSNKLRAAALSIILAWGWRGAGIALAAGVLSALAMAPFNAWPVLFLTFPVLVWLIDGAAAGKLRGVPAAAWTGFEACAAFSFECCAAFFAGSFLDAGAVGRLCF